MLNFWEEWLKGWNFCSPSLTHSSLRSPPLLACRSVKVSVREEVCDDAGGVRASLCLRHCLFLHNKPHCLEGR